LQAKDTPAPPTDAGNCKPNKPALPAAKCTSSLV